MNLNMELRKYLVKISEYTSAIKSFNNALLHYKYYKITKNNIYLDYT